MALRSGQGSGLDDRLVTITLHSVFALFAIGNALAAVEYASGCATACGNVTVQYPFGFTEGCGLPAFRLNCTTNDIGSPILFISTLSGQYQVLRVDSSSLIINATDDLRAWTGTQVTFELDPASQYAILSSNMLFGYGCDTNASFVTDGKPSSCTNTCVNEFTIEYCDYYACCQLPEPRDQHNISISANTLSSAYGYASIIYPETYSTPDARKFGVGQWGMVLGWFLEGDCSNNTMCSSHSTCSGSPVDVSNPGYVCTCNSGFQGDGYLNGTGCIDINECEGVNNCSSLASCNNTIGNYSCSCPVGFAGDGYGEAGCKHVNVGSSTNHAAIIAGASASVVLILAGVGLLLRRYMMRKRRKTERFRRRNIEALGNMQHFFSSLPQSGSHTATLYTLKELEKATRSFSEDLVLGSGGFGTVYKGTLDDGLEVAIKRTNNVDLSGAQQFFNEVSVLSQVNHRNLVKLLGCCLETEIPMLVYEFVPNGDLSQHLRGEKGGPHLNWENRLQIAMDTAEALRYLHSAADPPIYHRDMKTSNILLDDKLNAKVADFGISKLVKQDATHVSTVVQGTPGYLDPEYFHDYHLTDKSDVYSFGVVLLELITSLKPLDYTRETMDINLVAMAMPFIRKGNLEAIVDPRLIDEDASDFDRAMQEIQAVAELAGKCVADHRLDRPAMKDVVAGLMEIKGVEQTWVHGSDMSDILEQKTIEMVPLVDEFTTNSTSSTSSSNLHSGTRYW